MLGWLAQALWHAEMTDKRLLLIVAPYGGGVPRVAPLERVSYGGAQLGRSLAYSSQGGLLYHVYEDYPTLS